MSDPWAEFIPAKAAKPAADPWADFIPAAPSVPVDIAKSAGIGLADGTIDVLGAPRAMQDGTRTLLGWALGKAGVSDETRANIDTAVRLTNKLTPFGNAPSPSDIKKVVENVTGKFYEPQTTEGKYAKTIASFVPGALATPGALPSSAMGAAGNVAKFAVLPGVASEYAGQKAAGTGWEPAARIGGALAGGLAGAGLGSAARALTPKEVSDATARYAQRQMAADGMTPAAMADAMKALGPEAMAADVSPAFRAGLETSMIRPGPGQSLAKQRLIDRLAGRDTRLASDLDKLGPYQTIRDATEGVKAQRAAVHKGIDGALRNAGPIDTSPVLATIGEKLGTAVGTEKAALQRIRSFLVEDTPKGPVPVTDPVKLHNARMEIDNLIKYGDQGVGIAPGALSNTQGTIVDIRRTLSDQLKAASPDYAGIMGKSADLARKNDAIVAGSELMNAGPSQLAPSDLAKVLQKATPAEQEGYRIGSIADLHRRVDQSKNDLSALQNTLKGGSDWNTRIVKALHGDEAAAPLLKGVDREVAYNLTKNDALSGSQTARRLGGADDMRQAAGALPVGQDEAGFVRSLLNLRFGDAFARGVNKLQTARLDNRVNRMGSEFADLATAPADEFRRRIASVLMQSGELAAMSNARRLAIIRALEQSSNPRHD